MEKPPKARLCHKNDNRPCQVGNPGLIRIAHSSIPACALILVWVASMNLACLTRASLPAKPGDWEAQFIRVCEMFNTDFISLRTQTETMSALESISPPGRVCFVCQRLRACSQQLQQHQRATNLTAHQVSSLAFSTLDKPPPIDLLPNPGGELLQETLDRNCRACRSLPTRIQQGTW